MDYAGPGVVNVDRRQPGVRGHHSRVCGVGPVAAAVDGAVHDRRGLGPCGAFTPCPSRVAEGVFLPSLVGEMGMVIEQ